MMPSPPKLAQRMLLRFLRNDLAEEVLGDLDEKFYETLTNKSLFRAKANYWYQVANYMRLFAIRKSKSLPSNVYAMYQSYFKVGWRNLVRQKMYSSIKIGGFALGLATCILISIFILHELNYDKHYENGENIYRVYNDNTGPDGGKWISFPASAAQILKSDYPEVEKSGRLIPWAGWYYSGDNLFRRADQPENIYEEGFAYADQSLIEILQIPMVYGNPHRALSEPNSILISKRKSEKYFPGEDPTGRTVFLNDDTSKPFTIGGVMENFPVTSHLQFDFLITLKGVEFWEGEQTSWCCWNYSVYLQLSPGTDTKAFEKKILPMRDTHYIKYLVESGNQAAEDVRKNHFFRLQPISDIHLHSEGLDDGQTGDIRYVWLFGGIACFILLLACINFINLSTAKSANRAKEVGLRKVVGSLRSYLVRQFLTESLLFSFISFVLAVGIVSLMIPYFNMIAGKTLSIPWTSGWFFATLMLSAIVIGLVAGIYPAFYLSAFKPIDVLKGAIGLGSKSSRLRSVMVVFQFTTSIILIIGTFIIYRQMNYILNAKIGFDREQVVMIEGANTLKDQRQTFKNELLKLSGVENVTIGNYFPVTGTARDQNEFWRAGKSKEEKGIGAQRWYVDEHYISTLGMNLLEGRDFDPQVASDSQAIIINQAMVRALGLKKPLGDRVQNWMTYTIIGVVEDFHFESMKGEIRPLALVRGQGGSIVSVKVKSDNMRDMIQSLSATWGKFMPHQPIRYTFLDESYARMYDDVERMGLIFTSFAVLAIIVACLGLFALSAFMIEQRSKEISIRIVLGASLKNIFHLLTSNFVMLVLIAFAIAVPVAWYLMNLWLLDYKYKTDITWDVFVLTGIVSVGIALLTISYQTVRAALANPVNNLRSE